MIYFNFNIRNPKWWERFENIKCWMGETPFKHKFWEVEVIKNDNLLRLEFEVTTQQDHAGARLELGLLGYEAHFTFYDNRHWNSEEHRWMIYTEEKGLH
jgi:hypothetical protein